MNELHDVKIIPPYGELKLINMFGDDLTIVNAARVSFGAQSDIMSSRDQGLIKYLIREKHASPFEHVVFQFYVKCPIFVAREWMRHRWASYNEFSMRYSNPSELQFWIPNEEDWRKQVGKPGNYTFEKLDNNNMIKIAEYDMNKVYELAEHTYYKMVDSGIAKEIARAVLPVGMYTQFYFTVNARSLINFMSLRNDNQAQKEIQYFASAIEEIFAQKLPVTYNSFIEAGRNAI